MPSVIRNVFALVLALAAWWALLWFSSNPDFGRWSLGSLAAVHFAPPLGLWALWAFAQRYRNARARAAAKAREAALAKKCQSQRLDAREKHDAELQRLRLGCDCRSLALTKVVLSGDAKALVREGERARFSRVDAETDDGVEATLLDHLRPGIEEALGAIYAGCPTAAGVPIYVLPPADVAGTVVLDDLREVRARSIAALGVPLRAVHETAQIQFLPVRESVADSAIALFENAPDLPAALILAFDSPWWRARRLGQDESDPTSALANGQDPWPGAPGQAVIALLLTHPQLPDTLAAAPASHATHDALTPFWEKEQQAAAVGGLLAGWSAAERADLQRARPLARIHRAACGRFDTSGVRSMALTRAIAALTERAQVNAALAEQPFDSEGGARADADPQSAPAPACGWLVHNAGPVDHGGKRLAALGAALFDRGHDLDPIGEATNVVTCCGDLGQARAATMLALTVAQAASTRSAALCAEFSGAGLSLFYATTSEVSL